VNYLFQTFLVIQPTPVWGLIIEHLGKGVIVHLIRVPRPARLCNSQNTGDETTAPHHRDKWGVNFPSRRKHYFSKGLNGFVLLRARNRKPQPRVHHRTFGKRTAPPEKEPLKEKTRKSKRSPYLKNRHPAVPIGQIGADYTEEGAPLVF